MIERMTKIAQAVCFDAFRLDLGAREEIDAELLASLDQPMRKLRGTPRSKRGRTTHHTKLPRTPPLRESTMSSR